jgi:hypothetical protein
LDLGGKKNRRLDKTAKLKTSDLNSSPNTIRGIKVNTAVGGCADRKNMHGVNNKIKL